MSGLILQPCRLSSSGRKENFLASVARLRTVADVEGLLPPAELEALRTAVGENSFALWGAKRGRQSTFDRISPGMRVLFIGDKKAYADLTVLHRFSSPLPHLARAVWPSQGEDGEPWELVMALSAPRPIDLDYAVVKNLMNFEDNFVQRGLFVYTESSEKRPIERLIERVDVTSTASEPMWDASRRRRGVRLSQLTSRDAVLAAMAKFDVLGRDAFLATYGFGPAQTYLVRHEGREYDSKAIVGVAFGFEFPERGPLKPSQFSGGEASVRRALERLGFTVTTTEPVAPRLAWFSEMAGQVVPRDDIRSEHGLLVGAKGGKVIFKPAASDTALSIQVLVDSFYGPEEVHRLPSLGNKGDGWLLRYHREEQPDSSDSEANQLWTNRALVANMQTGQPLGVLIQTSRSPSTFLVQGLGYVVKQEGRRFWVASHNDLADVEDAVRRHLGPDAMHFWRTEDRLTPPEDVEKPPKNPFATFDPETVTDERERVHAEIVQRQGQGKFRNDVLRAYGYRCAVTEFDVEAVLEAAHILPYRGPAHNDVRNGILLRADLHTLMDRHLLRIDPTTRRIVLHSSLHDSPYGELHDAQIREPLDPASQPHQRYLAAAWDDGKWTAG